MLSVETIIVLHSMVKEGYIHPDCYNLGSIIVVSAKINLVIKQLATVEENFEASKIIDFEPGS